ncbi:MAG: hypothetical protein ACE5K7_03545 [Phycisphaerae bacterium]
MKSPNIALVGAMAAIVVLLAATAGLAGSPEQQLSKAIQLFEHGQYAKAHELLVNIDRAKLPEPKRAQRDDYLEKARIAKNAFAKAVQDKNDADAAFKAGQFDKAERFYRQVLANDYATETMKTNARQRLAVIAEKRKLQAAVEPKRAGQAQLEQPGPTDRARLDKARLFLQQGKEAAEAGMWQLAAKRYRQALALEPGMLQARQLLDQATKQIEAATKAPSLIDRIRQRNLILWQKAVAD